MKKGIIYSFLFFFCYASLLFSAPINKIVAVVGEEVLTLYELDEIVKAIYQQIPVKDLSPEEVEKVKEKLRREVLEQWIEDTVIGLEAKKYGIKVSEEEVDAFLKEELSEKRGNLTPEEREKLKDRLKKIKFVQFIVRERVVISEEELKSAYQEFVKNYDPTPKYKLEVLVIKEELLVKELYESALRGKPFQELWQKNVELTQYLNETFKEEELDQQLREEIKKLKPGEVLDPIKRGEGYHLIRLVKKEEGLPPSFEEVKKELYEELFQRKAREYLEKWIKELKETKFIKIYL